MALRWFITQALTGDVVREVQIASASLTIDLDSSSGSADLLIGHMIRTDGTLDLVRAREVPRWIEPAGAYALAGIDMEDTAAWGGQYDRLLGEWIIDGGTPATGQDHVPLALSGLLAAADDRLLERDYIEEGRASWIAADLLRAALGEYQVTIPKPDLGPTLPVDWRAGRVTYGQAIRDVLGASGLELAVAHSLVLEAGSPRRVQREIVMGAPLRYLNTGRLIDAGSNAVEVARPTHKKLWANSVNVYGSGSGDDQVAGNAYRGKPGSMPTITRSYSHPDVATAGMATALAAQHLASLTGVAPLQIDVLRTNWTGKFPRLGDAHRVRVDPCLPFPDGIDGVYRITRIQYQPPDGQGGVKPDVLSLIMEVSP